MLRAYKYRLYPTKSQEAAIQRSFGCARWVYNWALEKRNQEYAKTGRTLSTYDLNKMLTLEKKENPWLREVSDWVLKESVAHVGAAFQRFFEGSANFPKFKSKHSSRKSCTFRRMKVEGNRVNLTKIGSVKFKRHRELVGEVKSMTVSQNASGAYYISFLVEDGMKSVPKAAKPTCGVGIDVGLHDFCVLSTGEKIVNPKHMKDAKDKLAREQRKLSRKVKGSARYERQRKRVAKLSEHVANQRKDFQHKLSRRIVDENQVVAVEDLNVGGMLSNHKLAASIADAGWAQFVSMLEYKCEWYGVDFLQCGTFDPSTKTCSVCGSRTQLRLKDRAWYCDMCGNVLDRDVNAAQNILVFAAARAVNGRGGIVRPANAERYAFLHEQASVSEASSLRI